MLNRRHERTQAPTTSTLAVILLGLLVAAACLRAQSQSIPFARLSLEQGLSQVTVNCVLQDRAGFLWVGTQAGLNRYDGYGFRVYKNDPTDPSTLPANWIEALAEDRAGNLWIGTQGGGLARWHRATGTITRFQHDPDDPSSLPGNRVRALHFDRSGDLWVGTFQSGLARLTGAAAGLDTGRFERFRHDPTDDGSLSDDRVRAIHEDRAGNLRIGTLSGLELFDRATRSFRHLRHDPAEARSLSDDRVTSILEDGAGNLWVGTEKGLNRWEPGGASGFARYLNDPADPSSLSHDLVWALYEDRARRVWVGTDSGLNLRREDGFARYLHDEADPRSLSNDRVTSVFQDRGGVLWFGTQGGGLNKWNPITWSFTHYRADSADPEGLSHSQVFALSEDDRGRLWVGTFGGGLNILDRSAGAARGASGAGGRFTHFRHDPADPTSLAGDQITALLHDGDGFMWVGTATQGADRFDPATRTFRNFRHDPARAGTLSDDAVSALFRDHGGVLWVATFRGGLNRYDERTGSFVTFRHNPDRPGSLSEDSLTVLAEDAGGALLVGTFGGGLNRSVPAPSPPGSTFHRIRHDPGRRSSLSNDTVYALHVDHEGVLWVGTHVGLNKLEESGDPPAFRHFFERDGLASDLVYGVRSDDSGRLWIATNNGLSRFHPRTETFKNFRTSQGLLSNELNFGAHFRSRTGELFFGGVGGFNAFDPDEIVNNTAVPPVVLTSFTKLNEQVLFDSPISDVENIALSYRDDLFTFEFAALDFTAPEENRYRYKLEGSSDTWIDLGLRRQVTFTDLAPGDYVLRVQGSNNDGLWNEAGTAITLTIRPPFWRTLWFRMATFLGIACALLVAHRHRMAKARRQQQKVAEAERTVERERLISRLEAKNKELERFTYTVSHDLKAPLVTIKGFVGYLRQDAAAGSNERMDGDIERIAAAAEKMSVLLDDLLQLSRVGRQVNPPEEVPLGELAREAMELVAGQIDEKGVEVLVVPDLPEVTGDRARLVEVLQNLIQNAVKYMGDQRSPRVEIGARPNGTGSGSEKVFYVRDNGMGIEAQDHEKVFELFQRLSTETEGTGVGLALAKRIVEVHGGQIWVESKGAGCGSTFCFTLEEDPESSSCGDHSAA